MLYDKRWDKTTKADPYSLDTLIAWLEKQPAHKRYEYTSGARCLLAQYFVDQGFGKVAIGGRTVAFGPNFSERAWFSASFDLEIAQPLPSTFGAALKRACKLAAQTSA